MAENNSGHCTTTFQLSNHMHTQLKIMCVLTKKTMGEFIRLSIMDKMKELKTKEKENDHTLSRKTAKPSD